MGKTDVIAKIFSKKTITVDMFGFAFYRQFKYKMVTHARVFSLKPDFKITENTGLFLANSLHFLNKKFGYENMCSWIKIKDEKIKLPIKNKEIDFDFMEDFIAELEAERIAELEAYFSVTGLKDYNLTKEEQKALDNFENNKVSWSTFRIEDVLDWQPQIEIDPLKLDELKDLAESCYPFYGQASLNNGIISYNKLKKSVLNNNESKPTILIHSNNQNIIYLQTPFYLKDGHGATSVLQSDQLNKINQMFLIASISKVIKYKYSYMNKATKIELKNSIISLPLKDKSIDYNMMELFISAIQKLVIKNVVLYADRKINATKSIVGNNDVL